MQLPRLLEFKKEGIAKSAAIVLVYNLTERIIMMGRGIVFARLLGPAQYGVFSLAISFFPVAVALAKLGVPSCFTRYIAQYEMKGALKDFIKKTFSLVAIGAVILGSACVIFSRAVSRWGYGSQLDAGVIILCGLIVVPFAFYESLDAAFSGMRIFKLQSLLKFSHFLIFTVLGITLVIICREAKPLIAAYLAATVIATFFFGGLLKKQLGDDRRQQAVIVEPGFYKKIFAFSAAYIFSPVIFILFSYTDRWMLVRLTDLQHVGIYSAATRFSEFIFSFGMIAGNVLSPNLSQLWEEGKQPKARHFLNLSLKVNTLLLLGAAVVMFLLKDQIVPWFYGEKYIGALPVIGMILIFGILQAGNWTLVGFARLIEKTYIMPVCYTLGLLSNLVIAYLLIPGHGIMGAAAASTISSALILVVLMIWFHKEGLRISRSTLAVCFLPLILLLGKLLAGLTALILLVVILKTSWILDDTDRDMLRSQLEKAKTKFFKAKPEAAKSGQA